MCCRKGVVMLSRRPILWEAPPPYGRQCGLSGVGSRTQSGIAVADYPRWVYLLWITWVEPLVKVNLMHPPPACACSCARILPPQTIHVTHLPCEFFPMPIGGCVTPFPPPTVYPWSSMFSWCHLWLPPPPQNAGVWLLLTLSCMTAGGVVAALPWPVLVGHGCCLVPPCISMGFLVSFALWDSCNSVKGVSWRHAQGDSESLAIHSK